MVISRFGIVASENPLASQAGAAILARGGTAADAAIAADAMMGAVAPMMCGIGGDLFALVYEARTGRLYGLNASGWAPAKLSIDFLQSRELAAMPQRGIHSVTVPGAVDGWEKLRRRFGRKSFSELLAPAILQADGGFPVTELVAAYWKDSAKWLRGTPSSVKTYLPNGDPPKVGEIFHNPDLAWAYRQIAARGRNAFYQGEIARRLLSFSARLGGTMTADDLRNFSSEWVDPISTTYRGWTVYEIPPNGQGIAALLMLNIAETFPLKEWGHNSAEALHHLIEGKKLAYADLQRYVGDPRFASVPVVPLLDKHYARRRAGLIDQNRANCAVASGDPAPGGSDTTYLCAVDREGNMISFIQSNYEAFGSGLVADGTGFVLQNRGGLFSLKTDSPNALAGRKRPLHTIIPGFMKKDNLAIAFGIMGGWNQAQAHAQFVANVVDYGMNIQAALEAPRFTKITFPGCDVQMEARIPAAVRSALEARGHKIEVRGDFAQAVGGGQAVLRDANTRVNYGASDPRKDGTAMAEPPPKR